MGKIFDAKLSERIKFYALILILFIFACKANINFSKELIIEKDTGIGGLLLNKSTIKDVEKNYGTKYKRKKWREANFEAQYTKLGISFYYELKDTIKVIKFIAVDPQKFKGKTSDGLRIHQNLKVKDVIKIYGEPKWAYTLDSTELSADYKGISFYVKPDRNFTKENYTRDQINHSIHTNFYFNQKILDISIPF